MIKLMTGTPGSGKSHSMAFHIRNQLRRGRNVISTVSIDINRVNRKGKLKIGDFQYIPIFELTPERLERYALANHKKGKESQTYVFIDECQLIFNSRDYAQNDRKSWLVFFTSHRHYGYEFFLITQNDRMIDRQIRALVEHEVKHRKINNYLWFLPITVFVAVETWYGHQQKLKLHSEFILFRRSIAKMYDSYTLFDDLAQKYANIQTDNAPHPDAAPKDHQTINNEETPIEVVGIADTEVGDGGTHRWGGDDNRIKKPLVRLRETIRNFFTPSIITAPIKGNTSK